MTGSRLGQYELLEKVGEGGMGQVYRARDTKLGRDVAVKLLSEAVAGDPERLARFEREAQILAQLSHPNIAAIYGLETSGDTYALVMEFVGGPTLSERIRKGPVALEEVLPISIQICEALGAAHAKGIVHRDLKPANIKVTEDGDVKVLDFGLAKALEERPAPTSPEETPTVTVGSTKSGMILGTAGYMSPEQARGKPVDKRADIWAFGIVLYEMLTGRQMFGGETIADSLAGVLRAEIDLTVLPPDTPQAIRRLLRRCLERDRKKRLQDIGDARIELEEATQEGPSQPAAVPAERVRKPWPLLAAVAVVVALVGLLVGWQFGRSGNSEELPRRVLSLPVDGRPVGARISPDGGAIAYVARTTEGFTLWIQDLTQSAAVRVSGPSESIGAVAWSADGERLAFLEGQVLKTATANGTQVREVCRLPGTPSFGVTWEPSGASIIFSARPSNGGRGSMFEVPARGGEPRLLTPPETAVRMARMRSPSFLPLKDRRVLLFSSGAQRDPRLVAWDMDRGDAAELASGTWPFYSPSGHILYAASRTLWALPFSVNKLEATGEAFAIGETIGAASVSNDGTLVLVESSRTGPEQLVWKSRMGERLGTIGQPQERIRAPLISPDGKRVAVSGTENGNADIWIHDIERGIKTRVTSHEANEDRPIWSPDGKQLVFASNRDGQSEIFLQASDGSGTAEKVLPARERAQMFAMDWSSDGEHVVAVSVSRGAPVMVHFSPGGGEPESFLERDFFDRAPSFSPDSKWIAYESNESGAFEVYVRRFPEGGGKTRVSVNGGERPRWRGDGREIYFLEGETMMAAPITLSAEPLIGVAERLFEQRGISPQAGPQYDVSADGQRFVVVEPVGGEGVLTIRVVQNWFSEFRDSR